MNLSIAANANKFALMLMQVESLDGQSNGILTNWEREFVVSMREKFDGREDQIDLGCTPWSPTTNQWNTLHGIWSAL